MIERQFVAQKLKEFRVQEFVAQELGSSGGYSHTEIKRTPLGEKVVVYTSRPGLVVGKKGENIHRLTEVLKKRFKMENPQIEIGEIRNPYLDVHFVADRIASTFERFGSKRFKSVGYKMLQSIMDAGAVGAEIVVSGKVPSARARQWRFKVGYIKKSGDIAESLISKYTTGSNLKSGTVGIKVSIMTPDIILPDRIIIKPIPQVVAEVEAAEKKVEAKKEGEVVIEMKDKAEKPKRAPRKKKAVEKKEGEVVNGQDKKA